MIEDIVTDWNVLTVSLTIWASLMSLAIASDVAADIPQAYREKKARAQLEESVVMVAANRQPSEAKDIALYRAATREELETLPLFLIQKHGRHAKHN